PQPFLASRTQCHAVKTTYGAITAPEQLPRELFNTAASGYAVASPCGLLIVARAPPAFGPRSPLSGAPHASMNIRGEVHARKRRLREATGDEPPRFMRPLGLGNAAPPPFERCRRGRRRRTR